MGGGGESENLERRRTGLMNVPLFYINVSLKFSTDSSDSSSEITKSSEKLYNTATG